MKKIVLKNPFKSLKWFSYKRRWYIAKHVVVISILSLLFYFLFVNHLIAENNVFSLIAIFSLNYSFILIPALLYLIEVRKNFKKEFDIIFSLKDSLIYLRGFIAREISGLKNEEHRDIIIDPSNINQIIGWLRTIKFHDHSALFLSHIQRKRLYNLDLIIIDVFKKIKKYDSGKEFKNIEQNWDFKYVKEKIGILEKSNDTPSLKKYFLNDLTYPLVYSLMLNKANHELGIYYYITESYPNEVYQDIINSVFDIFKYNIKSEGKEVQEFDTNIVKAIEVLTRNQQELQELGIRFNSNLEKCEYILIIFNEPCDVLVVKIKIDKCFKVNSRFDTKLETAKDWVKQEFLAHLHRKMEKFDLKLVDKEFWI